MQTTLHIKGTHCESCKALLEDICHDIPGITTCTVNYETGETVIEHIEELDWHNLKKEIESLGKYSLDMPHQSPI